MKILKRLFILSLLITVSVGGLYFFYIKNNNDIALPTLINFHTSNKKYIIKKAGNIVDEADTEEEAIHKAKNIKRSIAINTVNNEWVYNPFNPFLIITDTAVHDFETFKEAIKYAKNNNYDKIYFENISTLIWEDKVQVNQFKEIEVPMIMQNPELPRGCEVTSLAMILKYRNIEVDKLTLATEIKKDTSPFYIDEKGRKHYGNPYDGFVGDMYNMSKNGYGVYHDPVAELAQKYCGDKVIDLTGGEFEDILYFLSQGNPIWVITNATYQPLDDSKFEIWHTPTGIVKITNKQHSVVIVGFDEKNVYINDPLRNTANVAINKEMFRKAWEQMGHQAITILK